MEVKLNKEQARQFAFDWYDIIASAIAKEVSENESQELKQKETNSVSNS